jgi:hypothetical protein
LKRDKVKKEEGEEGNGREVKGKEETKKLRRYECSY